MGGTTSKSSVAASLVVSPSAWGVNAVVTASIGSAVAPVLFTEIFATTPRPAVCRSIITGVTVVAKAGTSVEHDNNAATATANLFLILFMMLALREIAQLLGVSEIVTVPEYGPSISFEPLPFDRTTGVKLLTDTVTVPTFAAFCAWLAPVKTAGEPRGLVCAVVTVAATEAQPVAVAVKLAVWLCPLGSPALGELIRSALAFKAIVDGVVHKTPVITNVLPFSEGSSLPFLSTLVVTVIGPEDAPNEHFDAIKPLTLYKPEVG